MSKKLLTIIIAGTLVISLSSCSSNIYKGLHKDNDTVEEHVAKGNVFLAKGENSNAKNEFIQALELDPYNAEALYGHSKAVVREELKVDIIDLAQNFTDTQVNDYLLNFSPDILDSIYQVSTVVRGNLEKIAQGKTYGVIKAEDVYIDLGIAYALEAISYALLKAEELKLLLEDDGFIFENLDKLQPEDINDLIDTVDELLPQAQDYIDEVLTDQTQEIKDTINNVLNNIDKYKIELGVDNDDDGLIDEEYLNGIDDDNDGLIDEDSTGTVS